MKPFKTYRQQLKILRNRGLDVGNTSKTMRFLEESNYYDIINGYKIPFLARNADGSELDPERFKAGTKLEELYSLYKFDRELRIIFLKYFLTFESNLKSRVSYRFSEKYKKQRNAYLDFTNFSDRRENMAKVFKTINVLSSTISRYSDKPRSAIKHYIDNHGEVPLWVLVNYLSFGNISHFYSSMDDDLKNKIAKDFNKQWKRNYPGDATIALRSTDVEGIVQTVNYFRNTCAHEEILYTMAIQRPRNRGFITHFYENSNLNYAFPKKYNLFTVYLMIKFVLRKKDFQELRSALIKLFRVYDTKFEVISFEKILELMGFLNNWQEY